MQKIKQNTLLPTQRRWQRSIAFSFVGAWGFIGNTSLMAAPIDNGIGTKAIVSATQLRYTTTPSGNISGSVLTTQPVISAVDVFNNVDADYNRTITISETSPGVLGGILEKAALSGVASFTNLVYTATSDHESFVLKASDGTFAVIDSASLDSDVVATKLIFTRQPAPTSLQTGVILDFSTDPVVQAVDAGNIVDTDFSGTVTLSEDGAGTGAFANQSVSASSGVATFSGLTLNHDTAETFKLVASASGMTDGTSTELTNLALPVIAFSQSTAYSANENVGTSNVVTISRSGDTSASSSVVVTITGGTALSGTDYTNTGFPKTINFAAGETSKTVSVPIIDDVLYETSTAETIVFSLGTVSGATLGTQSTATLNIVDNESQPTVTLGLTGSPLAEDGGQATVTATLSGASTEAITVNLGFSGTATGNGTDYSTSDASIAIAANSTSGSITLTAVQDTLDEIDETIIVDIDSVTNGSESGTQQVTATITDDDNNPPTLTIFSAAVDTTDEDTEVEITLAELKEKGDEADNSDGTVDAFVVTEISSGSLKIGSGLTTATDWDASSNNTVDADNNAYWLPAENVNGTLDAFKVKAKDNEGAESATAVQVQVTVAAVNDKPTITSTAVTTSSEDVAYSYSITTNDVDDNGSDLTLTATTKPDWLTLADNGDGTATLSGTPAQTDVGEHDVTLQVADDDGASSEQTFKVTVAAVNDAPVLTSATSNDVAEGTTTVQTVTATDEDNTAAELSYSITSGADQALFSLDSSSGALAFKAAPDFDAPSDADSNNQYLVTVQVSDGKLTAEQTVTVTVTDQGVTLTAGQQYIIPLNSSNGRAVGTVSTTGDTVTGFTLSAGNDNGAFAIDNSGAITIADDTALTAGAHTLTVTATDGTTPVTATVNIFVIDNSDLTSDSDTGDNGINDALEQAFGTDDRDNDGIPDKLEDFIGRDIDGTTDTDSDGTPDVIEILNGRDPTVDDNTAAGAPTLTAATPKALLAKGILSAYSQTELGVTASDGSTALTPTAYYALGQCKDAVPYNYKTVCTPVAATGYTSGTHDVWWLVTDSDNNWAKAKQTLNILPQIGFSGDLTLAGTPGNGSVTTQLVLSGAALNAQAFNIPFTVSGTGTNPADHTLTAGNFTIQAGKTVSEPVTVTLGNVPTGGTTAVITLDTSAAVFATAGSSIDTTTQFVTAGSKTTQTVTISQGKVYPPRLDAFKGTQGTAPNQVQGLVFDKTQGDVTLSFGLTDPDGGNYTYSWVGSDSALNLAGQTTDNPTVAISTLAAGEYYAEVRVTDSTAPNSPAAVLGAMLTIVEANTLSTTKDTDGDGKTDAEEGLGDSDGDGRPDYLDAQNELANVIPTDAGQQQNYLVKTKPGLRIIFGTTAVAANTGDTKIGTSDLAQHGNKGKPVSDPEPVNATVAHLFDYEVENMDVPTDPFAAGNTVDVVLPLNSALAADDDFLKYSVSNGWRTFTEDTHNRIAWATWQDGVTGVCPDAGSTAYSTDSTQKAGANCLQVTIQDGGANDADGVVNGRIIDPLAVGRTGTTTVTITTENNGGSGGGGGHLPSWLLAGLGLLGLWRFRRFMGKLMPSARKGGQ